LMQRFTIEVNEIMVLINYVWEKSFARVESNRKAISERGWYYLNRNILLNTQLRSITTVRQHREENSRGIIIPYHSTQNFVEINENEPTLDPRYITPPSYLKHVLTLVVELLCTVLTLSCNTKTFNFRRIRCSIES